MISRKTIEAIRDVVQIEDVIGDFLDLKKRGSNLVGLCPFHHEKTPSFNVSPGRNAFKCFGCGRGGDAIAFVMEHEKYTYPEALRYLASKYQIPIEEEYQGEEERAARMREESFHLINHFAAQYFSSALFESDHGRRIGLSYFKERGFLESTIRKFDLGFAPDDLKGLTRAALDAGYQEASLRELGLMTQAGNDFFRNRVIFPIHNLSGKIIAFAGRKLGEAGFGPKYMNSPESPIYTKSKSLYGLHNARTAIRKEDTCILVEGYTDVLSLAQAGIENVVASSGTALTSGQIRLIKRFAQTIVILYDSDPAGIQAALRGLDLILEEDLAVEIVLLPDKEDPDSLIRKLGVDAFRAFIRDAARDFILFKAGLLKEEAQHDPIKRTRMIKDVVSSLAHIPDPIKRGEYIRQCTTVLHVSETDLVQAVNQQLRDFARKKRLRRSKTEINTDAQTEAGLVSASGRAARQKTFAGTYPDEIQERDVIRVLLQHGHQMFDPEQEITLGSYLLQNLKDIMDDFDNRTYRKMLDVYAEILDAGKVPDSQTFLQHPDEEIRDAAIDILNIPDDYSENWLEKRNLPLQSQDAPEKNYKADSYQSIMRLKIRKIEKKIRLNNERLQTAIDKGEEANMLDLIKIDQALKTMRNTIASEFHHVVLRV